MKIFFSLTFCPEFLYKMSRRYKVWSQISLRKEYLKLDGVAPLIADPFPVNSTPMHIRLVCKDRNLCLGSVTHWQRCCTVTSSVVTRQRPTLPADRPRRHQWWKDVRGAGAREQESLVEDTFIPLDNANICTYVNGLASPSRAAACGRCRARRPSQVCKWSNNPKWIKPN